MIGFMTAMALTSWTSTLAKFIGSQQNQNS